MNAKTVKAILSDLNPDACLFENMDVALIGVGNSGPNDAVAVYSRAKIMEQLLADGLSPEDAEDFFLSHFFNFWADDNTPFILDDLAEQ